MENFGTLKPLENNKLDHLAVHGRKHQVHFISTGLGSIITRNLDIRLSIISVVEIEGPRYTEASPLCKQAIHYFIIATSQRRRNLTQHVLLDYALRDSILESSSPVTATAMPAQAAGAPAHNTTVSSAPTIEATAHPSSTSYGQIIEYVQSE